LYINFDFIIENEESKLNIINNRLGKKYNKKEEKEKRKFGKKKL
jgi:hypothetical protein